MEQIKIPLVRAKQECIEHIQKRVGTALRKLKKENPGLGGKGKLTDSLIDKMQNYYGIAIRANVGNLNEMKNAFLASSFHRASSDACPLHNYCPVGADTSKVNKTTSMVLVFP